MAHRPTADTFTSPFSFSLFLLPSVVFEAQCLQKARSGTEWNEVLKFPQAEKTLVTTQPTSMHTDPPPSPDDSMLLLTRIFPGFLIRIFRVFE
ncbi:MAG: hypothetical protein MET45_11000 [Nostoc sp. LLA-1]|nr:hypothetical protein [Cyanocohniella sp. LLY]